MTDLRGIKSAAARLLRRVPGGTVGRRTSVDARPPREILHVGIPRVRSAGHLRRGRRGGRTGESVETSAGRLAGVRSLAARELGCIGDASVGDWARVDAGGGRPGSVVIGVIGGTADGGGGGRGGWRG